MRRLEGDWIYMVIDTKLPNAFVTELLPKRIFVTTAMLQPSVIANDDELAMVLGHEISHLILGHLTEQNQIETMLRVLEVLLLSMDPTEGVLSVVFVGALAWIRTALSASYSREHEREADALGLQLAARACFDTKKGAIVFQKLGDLHPTGRPGSATTNPTTLPTATRKDTSSKDTARSVVLDDTVATTEQVAENEASSPQKKRPALVRFIDSHPPSQERYEALLEAAEEENASKYCTSVHKRLKDYVLLR
uniref:Peptidase M48 domain-containing protein n=2 Tax=Grammatophora oceanica TaxID=210454 RepID=A0A7S1UWR7_9STRA